MAGAVAHRVECDEFCWSGEATTQLATPAEC